MISTKEKKKEELCGKRKRYDKYGKREEVQFKKCKHRKILKLRGRIFFFFFKFLKIVQWLKNGVVLLPIFDVTFRPKKMWKKAMGIPSFVVVSLLVLKGISKGGLHTNWGKTLLEKL